MFGGRSRGRKGVVFDVLKSGARSRHPVMKAVMLSCGRDVSLYQDSGTGYTSL